MLAQLIPPQETDASDGHDASARSATLDAVSTPEDAKEPAAHPSTDAAVSSQDAVFASVPTVPSDTARTAADAPSFPSAPSVDAADAPPFPSVPSSDAANQASAPSSESRLPSVPDEGAGAPSAPVQVIAATSAPSAPPTKAVHTTPSAPPPPPTDTRLSVTDIAKVQKLSRWASSALDYEDVETARAHLRDALHILDSARSPPHVNPT